ncbi:MAG: ribose-phosphate pyrophosphokinase [Sphingomonas sp.]
MDARSTSDADVAARIADVALVRSLLVAAARRGEWVSYSQALNELGTRFTRPKMRALCKTLGRIDELAEAAGEPELAVLVVREGDGLPGQGWWVGRSAMGYDGSWAGPEATALVRKLQRAAFRYWKKHSSSLSPRA